MRSALTEPSTTVASQLEPLPCPPRPGRGAIRFPCPRREGGRGVRSRTHARAIHANTARTSRSTAAFCTCITRRPRCLSTRSLSDRTRDGSVDLPINLHNQTRRMAVEIHDQSIDYLLPAEVQTAQSVSPQLRHRISSARVMCRRNSARAQAAVGLQTDLARSSVSLVDPPYPPRRGEGCDPIPLPYRKGARG